MIATTPAFKTVVEGVASRVAYRATIDLPGGVYNDLSAAAEQIQVALNTTTDVPEGVRVQPGYTTMTATITLSGIVDKRDPSKTARWLFGRYQKTSPLYGLHALQTPVRIDFGVYTPGSPTPEYVQKFQGYVDDYTVDHQTGVVTVTCVDEHVKYKTSLALPPVVTAPPYNANLTSEFAIDAVVRLGSPSKSSTWPAAREGCILSVGFRTSTWPETGSLFSDAFDFTQPAEPSFAPGVFGSALSNTGTNVATGLRDRATYITSKPADTDLFFECWVTGIEVGSDAESTQWIFAFEAISEFGTSIDFSIAHDHISVVFVDTIPVINLWNFAADLTPGKHYVAIKFSLPPVGTGDWGETTVWVDNDTHTFPPATTTMSRNADPWELFTLINAGPPSPEVTATLEAVQLSTESTPALNVDFVPIAVIDPSLNPLQVIPETKGDLWGTLQSIASAELGLCGHDESGLFRFYNRRTLRAVSVARTVYTRGLKGIQEETSAASFYNNVTADFTSWTFDTTPQPLWSLDVVTEVPAGQTVTLVANVTDFLMQIRGGIVEWLPDGGPTFDQSYYRASTSAAGLLDHPGLNITAATADANTVNIRIANNTSINAWLVSSADHTDIAAGTPTLVLQGTKATAQPAGTVNAQWPPVMPDGTGGAATSTRGDIPYDFPSNPWRQDSGAASILCQDVLSDLVSPTALFRNVSIVPDPRLQVPDHIYISDREVSGIEEYVRLWGWQMSLSKTAWDHTISARSDAEPDGWILGLPSRTELGLTTRI